MIRKAELKPGATVMFTDPVNHSHGHSGRLVSHTRSVVVVKVDGQTKKRHIPVTLVEGWFPKGSKKRAPGDLRPWPQ